MSESIGPIRPVGSGARPVNAPAPIGRRRPREDDEPSERRRREDDEQPDTPPGPDADGHIDLLA